MMAKSAFYLLFFIPFLGMGQASEKEGTDEPLIKSIYFGGGSYFVSNDQVEELEDFVTNIANIHEYVITIHSHTDNIGGAQYNKWLSRMRSESVLYELLVQDVPSDNIMIRDFGQDNPVFDNESWGGKRQNRRVDIIFEKVVF